MGYHFHPIYILILNIIGIFLAFGVVTKLYVWPRLRTLPRLEAIKILTLPHTFRFVGLSFLVKGVVSPQIDHRLAIPAGWGDFGVAVVALLVVWAITKRWAFTIPLVWFFNVWGTLDLLYANYSGVAFHLDPGTLGAAYYVPSMIVPGLLIAHGLIFWLLVKRRDSVSPA